ncbi:3009_t:CDS:10 [Ambispora gerdemannii]|uniref:3009_t:CDS:1 n=1 Tax=Ambispora gerdemannii TaxID=144530 RepID=A0A9N8ZG76_9GLOM|nr:3009_t:CDS:10 [Ambispora gerdemannii]
MPSVESAWLQNRNFGVVIDAGSSGSRVQIYSWKDHRWVRHSKPDSELSVLPTIELGDENGEHWQKKVEPGISSFAKKPTLVGPDHLKKLLDFALEVVPPDIVDITPVYVLATAGMRLLEIDEQQQIIDNACNFIRDNYFFRIDQCSAHVQVITGEWEGIFGWLAVNYLKGGFDTDSKIAGAINNNTDVYIADEQMKKKIDGGHTTTFGFLDMGGASAQIAFVPNIKEAEEHANDLTTVDLYTLAGIPLEYKVFVSTFLGFGTNEARRRYVEERIHYYMKTHEHLFANPENAREQPTTLLKDPCLPVDLILTDTTTKPPYYSLQGTGSFDQCLELTSPLINKTAPCYDNPCLFNGVHTPNIDFSVNHFIGISEFWYSTHEIFGFDGEWDYAKFKEKAGEYCAKHWNDLQTEYRTNNKWKNSGVDLQRLEMQCFKAAWLTNMLHEGINLPKSSNDYLKPNVDNNTITIPPSFQSINKIKDIQVSWTLGKIVLEASNLIPNAMAPNNPPPEPQGRGLFGYYNYMIEWIILLAMFLCCTGFWWGITRKSGYGKRRRLSFGFLSRLLYSPFSFSSRSSARDGGPDYGILDNGGVNGQYSASPSSASLFNLIKMVSIRLRLYILRITSPIRLFFKSPPSSRNINDIEENHFGFISVDVLPSSGASNTNINGNGNINDMESIQISTKDNLSSGGSNTEIGFVSPQPVVNISVNGLSSRTVSYTNLAKMKERTNSLGSSNTVDIEKNAVDVTFLPSYARLNETITKVAQQEENFHGSIVSGDSYSEPVKLPSDLEAAVTEIWQSNDPLDSSDFNPIEYINQLLPDEDSLGSVDITMKKLQIKMRQIENKIRELTRVKKDSSSESQGTEELIATKKAIEELFERIKQIKEKATQSEIIVQEITQDIKSLDYAKRHLTVSITTLKRLNMLVVAIDKLKKMARLRQYKETSQLLQAVLELAKHFQRYKSIKQISDLSSSVTLFQNDLKQQIFRDFDLSFSQDGSLIAQEAPLADACLVTEIMGKDIKDQLCNWYCEKQLREYKRIFRDREEMSSIDNLTRRYAWLNRAIKNYDKDHAIIFPEHWRLNEILSWKFCEITREDVSNTLKMIANDLDVKVLLKNVQLTIEFENQLSKKYNNLENTGSPSSTDSPKRYEFKKSISISFQPYLGIYIDAEDRIIFEMINSYRNELISDEDPVFISSTDLFYYYGETLKNFAKLSTGQSFLDLADMFGKWLKIYASDVLIGKLPKEEKRVMTRQELRNICIILNTTDYCYNTTSQLENKLIETIDEEYKDKINFEAEREAFLNVVTIAITSLVKGIETNNEDVFTMMSKKSWGDLESVGDQSDYVSMFQSTLRTCVVVVHKRITNNRYFRIFCDRFVDSFVMRIINNLTKCKPISEIGAEQLLLDIHALKTSILEIPTLGIVNPAPPPTTFVKIVNKGISKIETILKLVLTPHEPPDGLVSNYILLIGDRNPANIQKILDLKGIKKIEQQPIINMFQQRIQDHPNLVENSSILSLMTWSTSTTIQQSLPNILNNAALLTTNDRISIADRSGAAANRFNVGVRKVLAGRAWLRKDGGNNDDS